MGKYDNLGTFWKPPPGEMPRKLKKKYKATEKRKRKAERKRRRILAQKEDFFISPEWRRLRYRVIQKFGAKCMACGRTPKEHGIVIHCDHIKPRSKYPHLALVFENLQLLCQDCNLGKSNIDETDWRPEC